MTDAQRCPDVTRIGMETLVSAFTGEPFVKITLDFADGSSKAVAQMTADEARQHGLHMIEAAEAAAHDAAMARWAIAALDADPATAAAMVGELRQFRTDQQEDDRG